MLQLQQMTVGCSQQTWQLMGGGALFLKIRVFRAQRCHALRWDQSV
jgi:hypothetical protein